MTTPRTTEWMHSERAQQGRRIRQRYGPSRPRQRGIVWRRFEGSLEHRYCCDWNHVKPSVAIACAKRTARRLNREAS